MSIQKAEKLTKRAIFLGIGIPYSVRKYVRQISAIDKYNFINQITKYILERKTPKMCPYCFGFISDKICLADVCSENIKKYLYSIFE